MSRRSPYADNEELPRKAGEQPVLDPDRLPRQRRGTVPQGRSRYPEQDVMAERGAWDERTRALLVARVESPPPIRFFTPSEAATIGAFLDVVLAQDREPRVPALAYLDAKLHDGRLEGYQYVTLPDDRMLWRRLAAGLDEAVAASSFAQASHDEQERVVAALAEGRIEGAVWDEVDVSRAWQVVSGHAAEAFWSHPWAWNEMGFGGPAYPRGYMRLGPDQREPHETYEEAPD